MTTKPSPKDITVGSVIVPVKPCPDPGCMTCSGRALSPRTVTEIRDVGHDHSMGYVTDAGTTHYISLHDSITQTRDGAFRIKSTEASHWGD